jgi:hypothetical protein
MISGTRNVGSRLRGSRSSASIEAGAAKPSRAAVAYHEQDIEQAQYVPSDIGAQPPDGRWWSAQEQQESQTGHEDIAPSTQDCEGVGQLATPVQHQEVAPHKTGEVERNQDTDVDIQSPCPHGRDSGGGQQRTDGERHESELGQRRLKRLEASGSTERKRDD